MTFRLSVVKDVMSFSTARGAHTEIVRLTFDMIHVPMKFFVVARIFWIRVANDTGAYLDLQLIYSGKIASLYDILTLSAYKRTCAASSWKEY